MDDFLTACRLCVGHANVLTAEQDKTPYETEWRRRVQGKALAVIRPGNTDEVAAIVALCHAHQVPVVPQGGNTGLVIGSIPDQQGSAIILSLRRMTQIRAVDAGNFTLIAEAGCTLAQVQQAADAAGLLFPLSLASEGSCTIGGNLASNAGGTAVLRYGNARELCLGLEVVSPDGQIWHGLSGLRKDNTGYDLRQLYIGSEGTLGIITAAVLKLYPKPAAQKTAWLALESPQQALQVLRAASEALGAMLTTFELMAHVCLGLVLKHLPGSTAPLAQAAPYYILLELSDQESEQHGNAAMEQLLQHLLEAGLISDAAIAGSLQQARQLWALRENISMAQAAEGKNLKHDISVPISAIPAFIAQTDALLQQHFPACQVVCFGHMGDGNLHYNVSPPSDNKEAFFAAEKQITTLIHDQVQLFHGSISAEHGIGAMKRADLAKYTSPTEMLLMRTIKQALDPLNIMNPGKIL
ncbi:FAD-binding oxidoreductase [Undibacterium curvum]|uniref:FAD-binding oxidoreductase n=1 Tax=Undibacterium curvum TaxID=2762294 RepID=A0ABR7A0R7_9BURK|nr:FAD-binding oxidoreductase [Undibacterium curvum]MBC3930511.1 FAD-binding oxidoreductase [Undibacterium curvum]